MRSMGIEEVLKLFASSSVKHPDLTHSHSHPLLKLTSRGRLDCYGSVHLLFICFATDATTLPKFFAARA